MHTHLWPFPDPQLVLENSSVRLSPIVFPDDLAGLYDAASIQTNGEDLFTYHLNTGPFANAAEFEAYLERKLSNPAEVTYKVVSHRLGKIVGAVSLMNIKPEHGCLEVGAIWYCKQAQRSEINSKTMLLLFSYVFDELKYRRLEWKCNNLNEDSKKAALRLGFSYEGLFRQHFISRGVNRDTAWFSIIDSEWKEKKAQLMAKISSYEMKD